MRNELDAEEVEDSTDESVAAEEVPEVSNAPQKRRGRPKGYPKTGGRKKGTRNWSQPEIRAELLNRSNAIDVLSSIASGEKLFVAGPTGKPAWRYPTMKERLHALDLVFAKVAPDLTARELTGADGSALIPHPGADEAAIRKALLEHVLAHKNEDNDSETRRAVADEGAMGAVRKSGAGGGTGNLPRTDSQFSSESQIISEPSESQIPPDDSDTPVSNSGSARAVGRSRPSSS